MFNRDVFSTDTIAAVATPQGSGGIAILKVSGPQALAIVSSLFHARLSLENHPRVMIHGTIWDTVETIDKVLCCFMRGPHSYTGEDVVEIQTHGGRAAVSTILDLVIARGARPAEPGEFTRRAFLAGKIDLIQAEAIQRIVDSESRESLRSAERLLSGSFSAHIQEFRTALQQCSADLELSLDFSDQDTPQSSVTQLKSDLEHIAQRITALLGTCEQARRIRDGIRVVIAGSVNVGKSSLFNTLLGKTRAIVNARPGTTRDWIEERLELDGFLFIVSDTAGIRESEDEIEQVGVRESRRLIEEADIILHVLGPGEPLLPDLVYPQDRTILLSGKADLLPLSERIPDSLAVSAFSGEGLDQLRSQLIKQARRLTAIEPENGMVLIDRHRFLLSRARDAVLAAAQALDSWSEEIASLELSAAANSLDTLLGINTDPDILDTIFRNFCIGK